jgi:hypothetical protein
VMDCVSAARGGFGDIVVSTACVSCCVVVLACACYAQALCFSFHSPSVCCISRLCCAGWLI